MRGVLITAPDLDRAFDLDRAWAMDEQVALRPERFGALAYHFGTRRLSFIKDHGLLAVVRLLGDHPTARAALDDAGIADDRRPAMARALSTLAGSRMIVPRPDATTAPTSPEST